MPAGSVVQRVGKFIREVRAEMRKVVWPKRDELITYTAVVILTVAIVASYTAIVDFLVTRGLLLLRLLRG